MTLGTSKDGELEKQVADVLEKKIVWPWVEKKDDGSDKRLEVLKTGGKYTLSCEMKK